MQNAPRASHVPRRLRLRVRNLPHPRTPMDKPRPSLLRKAFVMSVHAASEQEYERRHRPIWKELEDTLRTHGVRNYSIFLLPATRQLFAYAEIEDEAKWNAIAQTDICK